MVTRLEGILSPNGSFPFDVAELEVEEDRTQVDINAFVKYPR